MPQGLSFDGEMCRSPNTAGCLERQLSQAQARIGELKAEKDHLQDEIDRLDRHVHELDDDSGTVDAAIDLITNLETERDTLQTIADAADPFRAVPSKPMRDDEPFNQYTTAGDCKTLDAAFVAMETSNGNE